MPLGETFEFQPFLPFPFLQPHLEPTDDGNQECHADEPQGAETGHGVACAGKTESEDTYQQERQQVDQPIFLYVSLIQSFALSLTYCWGSYVFSPRFSFQHPLWTFSIA